MVASIALSVRRSQPAQPLSQFSEAGPINIVQNYRSIDMAELCARIKNKRKKESGDSDIKNKKGK